MIPHFTEIPKNAVRALRELDRLGGILLVCVLTSCVGVRPIDPSAGRIELAEDEGILLLHLQTDVPFESLVTTAGTVAENVSDGEHLLLLAATAGSYRWGHLERRIGPWRYLYFFDPDDDRVQFHVEAGKINYPGSLVLYKPDPLFAGGHVTHNDLALALTVVNRSTTVLEEFESQNAPLLERFSMRYSGWGRDDFLERYLEARRRLSNAASMEGASP